MGKAGKGDLELLADFRRGDALAFQKLVRRHHLSLFNFFYALVRNSAQAENLTKEAFAQIFDEHANFPGEWTFPLGMLRAGCACWYGHLRRHGVPLPLEHGAASPNLDDEIRRHFETLPPGLKLVLTLSEVNGLSYAEIARVLDTSVPAVSARMDEAYAALRTQLSPRS